MSLSPYSIPITASIVAEERAPASPQDSPAPPRQGAWRRSPSPGLPSAFEIHEDTEFLAPRASNGGWGDGGGMEIRQDTEFLGAGWHPAPLPKLEMYEDTCFLNSGR